MAETLLQFQQHVVGPDQTVYEARACGSPMAGGTWQGWIEFVPLAGGELVRSPRETTQPNRDDTLYWATGLSAVYLQGALSRALAQPLPAAHSTMPPTEFSGPASSASSFLGEVAPASILDPFSVYEKGETLLRRQLTALSAWHLVNIAVDYELTDVNVEALHRLPAGDLIELIVRGVQKEIGADTRA